MYELLALVVHHIPSDCDDIRLVIQVLKLGVCAEQCLHRLLGVVGLIEERFAVGADEVLLLVLIGLHQPAGVAQRAHADFGLILGTAIDALALERGFEVDAVAGYLGGGASDEGVHEGHLVPEPIHVGIGHDVGIGPLHAVDVVRGASSHLHLRDQPLAVVRIGEAPLLEGHPSVRFDDGRLYRFSGAGAPHDIGPSIADKI